MSGAEDDDDEALSWAGGRDPSHYETPEPKGAKPGAVPVGAARATKSAKKSARDPDGADDAVDMDAADDDAPPMSSVVLVSLGVLGGIYALYTVGWIVSWQRLLYADANVLELAAFHVQQWLGIVAAPLWFAVALIFTRGRRAATRLLILLIGALVLIPWPFVFGR